MAKIEAGDAVKFGMTDAEWDLLNTLAVKPLKERGAQVWLFGSRSRGEQRDFSDVDLLFNATSKLPEGFLYSVKCDLEESNLPYKVDLVDFDEIASSYRDSILSDKVLL